METKRSHYIELFQQETLDKVLPAQRTDEFFEALLGDAQDGAYDIRLRFKDCEHDQLLFELELHERPGKCLACHLTYGLPKVFSRHPVINLDHVVKKIDELLNGHVRCRTWRLGPTREINRKLHVVPLIIGIDHCA
ncbi:MAG: pancreas/duodenum homeobox protein 1 [Desulfobacteraceae bacterium]|nr:pancreas/duodenum homeobox protein 1 [Desulfobacteraceae bacterium]